MMRRRWWWWGGLIPLAGQKGGEAWDRQTVIGWEGEYVVLEVKDIELIDLVRPLATGEERNRTGLSGKGKESN